jgi:hypothetical protein
VSVYGMEVYLDAFRNGDGHQLDIQRSIALTSPREYNTSQFAPVSKPDGSTGRASCKQA